MTTCSHPACWSPADVTFRDAVLGVIARCSAHLAVK